MHFKGIAFNLRRDRTEKRQSNFSIVASWRKSDGGTSSCLFASVLRLKIKPDQIAAIRDKARHLPDLASSRRSRLNFRMDILSGHPFEQVFQPQLASPFSRANNDLAVQSHNLDICAAL